MNKRTIHNLFEEHAARFPTHIAVRHGEHFLTYETLNKKANQLAHYLQEQGVKPDMPIALCLERSFDFLISIIAILKAGCAYLPIDATQPNDRLLFLLTDSNAPLLITYSNLKEQFALYQGQCVYLDTEQHYLYLSEENPVSINVPEHLAYIIYTSGSTGTPKGVLIEHHSVINYCHWFAQYSQCQPQQRIDFSSNPVFDMAITASLVPLMLGLTIIICDDEIKKDVQHYLHHLADSQTNIVKITPSYLKIILQESQNNFIALPHLHSIILGGENLSSSECQAWIDLYPQHQLFNEYGPTETTVAVTVHKVCRDNITDLTINVPIGKSGHKMHCLILNTDLKPVAQGETGELFIGGDCLARGYLNNPHLTQKQFIQNSFDSDKSQRLYKTGDLCRQQANGIIEYLGRIDDQVKIRGFRIEPGEIEKHLAVHPAIKTVAVVAQKDALNEQRLVAYYILNENAETPRTKEIRDFLQQHVPDYMIPAAFIKVDNLPLTANGKLDKTALPLPELESSQHYVAPATPTEKLLARLWSEELGVKLIGLNDNFYELGGHSLSAARLVSKINHELEKHITLYDFYQAGCIAHLIPIIRRTKKFEAINHSEISYKDTTKVPLSDFQFVLWMADTFEPKIKKLNIVSRKHLQGRLDKELLERAFNAAIQKHEVLLYRFYKLKPIQHVQQSTHLNLIEHDLTPLSQEECDKELNESMQQLINFNPWPKNKPLIIGKLFHLNQDESELQIGMPHQISDDVSLEILFADLSRFYLLYAQQKKASLSENEPDELFKKYILHERQITKNALEQNMDFWEQYLSDASFFAIPQEYVVEDMKKAKLTYSTYSKISRRTFTHLRNFCEKDHISINNGLMTILALALRNVCGKQENEHPYKVMNIIRSTRDNPLYDHSMGCFLRVEPIKIALNNKATLRSLSQQIRQSIIDTSNYQHCPNLVKLSSTSTLNPNVGALQKLLIDLLTPTFSKILQIPSMYRKILQRRMTRLLAFKKNRHFLVTLNVRHDFITRDNKKTDLFGLKLKKTKNYHEDLLAIDYVLEACFLYNEDDEAHYLVISANLEPAFREQLADEIIRIMDSSWPRSTAQKAHLEDYTMIENIRISL